MRLANHTALVTGGAVRLGRSIAVELARRGANVVIHYQASEHEARRAADEIRSLGAKAWCLQADLTQVEAMRTLIDRARAEAGPLHVLVNSAARFLEGAWEADEDTAWNGQMHLNLRAPLVLSRTFARQLPEDREGCIINLLDTRVFRPGGDHLVYRLTKAALADLTRNLAAALAPRIRVNGVAPGAVLAPPGQGEEYLLHVARTRVPLRRPGDAQAVAEAVCYLAESPFVTGAILPVDGGEALGPAG